MTEPQSAAQRDLREAFLRADAAVEAQLDPARLSASGRLIHARHADAVRGMHFTYEDPATGLKVFTRLRHWLKGKCCGSACRHCVYDHAGVAQERKVHRRFNSAFWEDIPKEEQKGFFDR